MTDSTPAAGYFEDRPAASGLPTVEAAREAAREAALIAVAASLDEFAKWANRLQTRNTDPPQSGSIEVFLDALIAAAQRDAVAALPCYSLHVLGGSPPACKCPSCAARAAAAAQPEPQR